MIKKFLTPTLLFFVLSLLVAVAKTTPAYAAYNHNLIMSDVVFDNYNSMNAAQIDTLLNSFSSSCLSTNNGFSTPDPNGYSPSTGFSYGGNVSGGTAIYHTAQAYGINPQVILATLQKESSVVTGTASYHCQYMNTAMGYDCPDSGSCPQNPATESGFSKQIIHAAWMLRFHEQRSKGNIGWQETKPGWDNSDDPQSCYSGRMTQGTYQLCPSGSSAYYDGWYTIDGSATHMDSGATAALYDYTPHFSGNQNFVNIFNGWFGSTTITIPFAWAYDSQQAFTDAGMTQPFTSWPTITPGGTIYVKVRARNIGNQVWYQNVILGTTHPNNRTSPFADSSWWLNGSRPAHLLENSVGPGQTGTFAFSMRAPNTTGTYNEYFNLLIEGQTWYNDPGLFYTINVVSPTSAPNSSKTGLVSGGKLLPGQYLLSPDTQSILILQTDGNLVLYSNFNKVVWTSGTGGKTVNRAELQGDGNLVLFKTSDYSTSVWDAGTWGHPGAHLDLGTNGTATFTDSGGTYRALGSAHIPDHLSYVNTSISSETKLYPGQRLETANRRYHLLLQEDGNLVLFSPNRAIWTSQTNGKPIAFLAIQSDGNLVLYTNSITQAWTTRTAGWGPSKLVLQSDGNLILFSSSGLPTWASNTAGVL